MADHADIDHTGITGAGSPTEITDIPTGEMDDALVLAPDGAGGVEFRAEAGLAGPYIKRTVLSRQGNITSTSTTFVVIDNTKLPALSIAGCAVGDIIEMELVAQFYNSGANAGFGDWQVVQPTLGTRRVSQQPNDSGVASALAGVVRITPLFKATWICAEAGTHTFQPMWRTTAGTITLANATSGSDDTTAQHIIKRWPAALVL